MVALREREKRYVPFAWVIRTLEPKDAESFESSKRAGRGRCEVAALGETERRERYVLFARVIQSLEPKVPGVSKGPNVQVARLPNQRMWGASKSQNAQAVTLGETEERGTFRSRTLSRLLNQRIQKVSKGPNVQVGDTRWRHSGEERRERCCVIQTLEPTQLVTSAFVDSQGSVSSQPRYRRTARLI